MCRTTIKSHFSCPCRKEEEEEREGSAAMGAELRSTRCPPPMASSRDLASSGRAVAVVASRIRDRAKDRPGRHDRRIREEKVLYVIRHVMQHLLHCWRESDWAAGEAAQRARCHRFASLDLTGRTDGCRKRIEVDPSPRAHKSKKRAWSGAIRDDARWS